MKSATPSELQQTASRANGAKSLGPVTDEGKQASSQNRRTHGLLSKKVVLDGESQEEFDELLASYLEEHQPQTPTERSLIESMVAARWRQERVWTLETAAMNNQICRPRYVEGEDFPTQAYVAFHTLTNDSPSFELLNRYEARFERQFRAALTALLALRAKRAAPRRDTKPAEPAAPDPETTTFTLYWLDEEGNQVLAPHSLPDPDPGPGPGSFGSPVSPAPPPPEKTAPEAPGTPHAGTRVTAISDHRPRAVPVTSDRKEDIYRIPGERR